MKVIGYIIYLLLSITWSGYVLSVLWSWFVFDRFPGAPVLSIANAIGVTIIVRYLTHQQQPEDKSEKTKTDQIVNKPMPFTNPLLALLFGAIVRMFL